MKRQAKAITILMADDNTVDCLLVKEAVKKARLYNDLRFVENGVELMDYLHRRGKYTRATDAPRPGLILLDLNMPRKDGREALAEIKADPELHDIPVVVMTSSKADEDFWRSRGLGANIYLVKPVTFDALVNVVKSLGRYWFEIVDTPEVALEPTRSMTPTPPTPRRGP
jgi:CheY-like chemotaxis protein